MKLTLSPTYLTVPSAPPRAVTVATVKLSNSSSISVSWEPPPSDMQNGVIQEYRVKKKTPEWSQKDTKHLYKHPKEHTPYCSYNSIPNNKSDENPHSVNLY